MKVLFWMFIGFDRHATSEHLLSAVIEQLCKEGHTVHIIQKDTGGSRPPIPESLTGYPITTDVIPFEAAAKDKLIARYLVELKYINACKKYITPGYDAVFIQSNNVAGFAVKAIRRKLPQAIVTFNVQDVFPYNALFSGSLKRKNLAFKALAAVQRYGYKHSDHIITISEDMKETLVADGTPPDKIEVIYNWSYQDELYEGLDLTPVSHMFDQRRFNVVYAGNIGVMQNVDILIEAAKRMKTDDNVWFHIVGNGVYKDKLEARAREYDIRNISFWPMQPPKLAPMIYASADVNIIPLAEEIYRTALPSKTATCLASNKPTVFVFGPGSRFLEKIEGHFPVLSLDNINADELKNAILKSKKMSSFITDKEFYLTFFSKTYNSQKYAKIIHTNIEEKKGIIKKR